MLFIENKSSRFESAICEPIVRANRFLPSKSKLRYGERTKGLEFFFSISCDRYLCGCASMQVIFNFTRLLVFAYAINVREKKYP